MDLVERRKMGIASSRGSVYKVNHGKGDFIMTKGDGQLVYLKLKVVWGWKVKLDDVCLRSQALEYDSPEEGYAYFVWEPSKQFDLKILYLNLIIRKHQANQNLGTS